MLSKLLAWFKGPEKPAETKFVVEAPEPSVGIELLHYYEKCHKKLPNGMIAPYLDAVGVPTLGWGNTRYLDGTKVKLTDPAITQIEADELFKHTYEGFYAKVKALLPLNTPKRDIQVFTCFAYNIGIEGFNTSTARKKYLEGDLAGCVKGLEMWCKGGGKVLKGLQRRRRAEGLVLRGSSVEEATKQAGKDYP